LEISRIKIHKFLTTFRTEIHHFDFHSQFKK